MQKEERLELKADLAKSNGQCQLNGKKKETICDEHGDNPALEFTGR